ncbi:AAA family ATPase [Leucobacter massiliensis]|uniref:AAA family ATPase n=1 Tax=Leucobacter massiliensis TaxID=1686285 RepID=A0A2S9QPU5_9MICO|nr:AAA family ATPase [Leucobacter massiliensis]PRI11606.1 AAA family ATPase [Leucobacter massiliensis]
MWSVDRRRRPEKDRGENGTGEAPVSGEQPRSEGALATAPDPAPAPREDAAAAPDLAAQLAGPVTLVDSFADEHADWRRELAGIGGRNPLLHFDDRPANRIELSTTHPGGLPQFITGNKILLSALIRDDLALRHARAAAGRVTDKAIEMRTVRGLETVNLGIGIAKWSFEGEDFCAPVLLRPLAIRRYGRDFELKLKQFPVVNSELIRVLRAQFGITLDARVLIELSQSEGVFKPQPVIDRLRQMVAGVPGFVVQPRLVVSSFHNVSQRMASDAKDLDVPILAAVCGNEPAKRRLAESYRPVSPTPPDERSPDTDRCLYDADAEQDDVLAQIDAGHSLVVHTLPGTGGTQTVVNAIGNLVRAGKRVLVVSPRRATLDGITHRLSRAGLAGLAVSPRRLRRNLVEAISRNENARPEQLRDVDEALTRLRGALLDYQRALTEPDPTFGVSPLDALRRLTVLALGERPPSTTVRLDEQALGQLTLDRSSVAEALTEVARLGQFQYGPEDSPWYGVDFATTEEARSAYALAVDLAESQLPRLVSMANEVVSQTSMRPYETIAELGVYLRLLMGIRDTLDRFTPEVYDRSLTEVIAAHAPRGSDEMSAANKRRLRKLAREYVRPGVHIGDMYSRLVQIQQQRVLWQRYTTVVGARPEVPLGIADVVVAFQSAYQDLDQLDRVLGVHGDAERLKNLSLARLAGRVSELARESEVLQNIQERTAIVERLRAAHLEPLLDDLSARHVPAEDVADELELAWWQSALERMLQTNPALLSANTSVIERLEADFRLVDDAHCGANGALLASSLADAWRVAVLDHKQEALAMREALRGGYVSVAALAQRAPTLLHTLAPVWTMSPYEVAQLPDGMRFDAALLVDAGATTLAENLSAIRRAEQVVAFGDTMTQTPSRFEISVGAPAEEDAPGEEEAERLHQSSAFAQLGRVLPTLALTRSYRAGGEDLTDLVNTRFYGGAIQSLPWAGSFLGHSSLTYEFVHGGQGLPDQHTGAVESTDAEVERVVQLVLEHASERISESLMVITASERHAVRVYQAVLQAFSKFPQYREFLLGERAEPFAVLTLEQATAQSRDRVIFSIGYGRTPHGRVLSNFGALGRPGGERLLAVAMTRARRAMTIVSCFKPEDLDTARIKHGVVELAELLAFEHPQPQPAALPAERDPMLGELADRLRDLGLTVAIDYRGAIPLAASLGERAIAVDLDFGTVGGESLRDTLRLRPAVLRRLGWHYHRVQSFDLFADPAEVALRIARIVGYDPEGGAAA